MEKSILPGVPSGMPGGNEKESRPNNSSTYSPFSSFHPARSISCRLFFGCASMNRIAIFIDGAYFQHVLREEFASAQIDFRRLALAMAGGREILRTYYYDCLPYQSASPTPDERDRFGKKQRFFAALEHLPRFQVRQGRLECRGRNQNGVPIFEQKRVDILLGVDLALLAAKHQISDAAVLAGDSDFLPAIDAAKAEGVVLHLFHGQYPHHDLLTACDERTRMDQTFIDGVRRT
jgi:uncharacterized LabA/DUF88 family protein